MSNDPRVALQSLVSALEEHLAALSNRRGDDDPSVDTAYVAIADAFDAYEEALYESFDEVTPLAVFADDEDDDDDDDFDEEDDEDDDFEDFDDESDDDSDADEGQDRGALG